MNQEELKNIKKLEDLSAELMKSDEKIQSTWTREGTIFLIWKENQKFYKNNEIVRGGLFLDYNVDNAKNCFTGVFRSAAAEMGS